MKEKGESARVSGELDSSKRRVMSCTTMKDKCLQHSRMSPDVALEGDRFPTTNRLDLRGWDSSGSKRGGPSSSQRVPANGLGEEVVKATEEPTMKWGGPISSQPELGVKRKMGVARIEVACEGGEWVGLDSALLYDDRGSLETRINFVATEIEGVGSR